MTERTVRNLEELDMFAAEILSVLPAKVSAHVLALSGELGAGKTALTQALAKQLGVREHVTSPTFVIMRTYQTVHETITKLVHIDAYRVEDVKEIEVLHIPELFKEKGAIVCIEWPERIASLVPKDALAVHLTLHKDNSRTVTYTT